MARSTLWKVIQNWAPSEWMPLPAAVEQIEKYAGDLQLAGGELRRHVLAGDLQSAAIVRRPQGEERLILTRAAWRDLGIGCTTAGKVRHLGGRTSTAEKSIAVYGTIGDEAIKPGAWHFFVCRAELDKLYPAAPKNAAQEGIASISKNLPPRLPGTTKYDWFAICAEISRRCHDDQGRLKVPKNESTLAEAVANWYGDQFTEPGQPRKEPAISEIRKAVRQICAPLRSLQR